MFFSFLWWCMWPLTTASPSNPIQMTVTCAVPSGVDGAQMGQRAGLDQLRRSRPGGNAALEAHAVVAQLLARIVR
jgi:hypothetical protein